MISSSWYTTTNFEFVREAIVECWARSGLTTRDDLLFRCGRAVRGGRAAPGGRAARGGRAVRGRLMR